MLLVPTELRPSPIHGMGVFVTAPVGKGTIVWRFDARIDRVFTAAERDALPELNQAFLKTYAILHRETGLWMLCGDDARFFNHADNPTTASLGIGFGDDIAAYNLVPGTELTTDYRTICDTPFTLGIPA